MGAQWLGGRVLYSRRRGRRFKPRRRHCVVVLEQDTFIRIKGRGGGGGGGGGAKEISSEKTSNKPTVCIKSLLYFHQDNHF